jgi:hypothetical protein
MGVSFNKGWQLRGQQEINTTYHSHAIRGEVSMVSRAIVVSLELPGWGPFQNTILFEKVTDGKQEQGHK